MRKKISIIILLCLLMITVTGCGTKKDNVLSTSEVKIESLKKYENSKLIGAVYGQDVWGWRNMEWI